MLFHLKPFDRVKRPNLLRQQITINGQTIVNASDGSRSSG
jgi:hypothetical protein